MIASIAIVCALLIIFVLYYVVENIFLDIDEKEEEEKYAEEQYIEQLRRRYYDNE